MRRDHPAVLQTYLELLESLSHVSPVAVTVSDLEGRVIFASARSAALHGFATPEDLLGRSAFELVAPAERTRATENLRRTLSEGRIDEVCYDLLRRDGTCFPAELSATVLLDPGGDPVGFVAFVRDRSPQLAAQAALQESQERYARLVDVMPDPVVVLQDGRYVFANAAFTRRFGYSQQDVQDGLSFSALVREEDIPAVKTRYEARLAGPPVPRTFRIDLLHRDGQVINCETTAVLIQHGGRPADLVVIRDIGDRVETERELERRSDRLSEANQRLEEANRQLQRLHRSKDELMATVSHELRTPLVTGLGYLDLLEAGRLGELPEAAVDRIRVARRNLLRLATLIDGILDYHSLVSRESAEPSDQQPTDLAALCRETVRDFLVRSDCPPERLTLSLPDSRPVALAAPDLIRRVLDNLLDNAHRHGGARAQITLRVERRPEDRLRIVVSDDGVGIPRRLHETIFDPFVRPAGEGEGSGLGLAVVWQLLQLHDTQPQLRSDARRGTEVSFTLPGAPDDALAPAPPRDPSPAVAVEPLSGTVLVVDDDADTREFLDLLLSGAGFTVQLAHSAEAGLALLNTVAPDVLLLDMSLPGMDGATLCRRLKDDPETRQIPVCMFTARAELKARSDAHSARCDAFLVKPVSPGRLLDTLRELIKLPPKAPL